jgi:hypothetical protein
MTTQEKLQKYIYAKSNPATFLLQELSAFELSQKEALKEFQQLLLEKLDEKVSKFEKKEANVSTVKIAENLVRNMLGSFQGEVGPKGECGEKGETGETGKSIVGPKGEQGVQGIKGERGLAGKDGRHGLNGLNGNDGAKGADGSPDKPAEVKKKLETLQGDERLDASAIKNLDRYIKKETPQRFGAGGGGGMSMNGWVVDELVGTGDNLTVAFTLDYKPYDATKVQLWVGNAKQFRGDEYTISGKNITFLVVPPDGYKIFASYYK